MDWKLLIFIAIALLIGIFIGLYFLCPWIVKKTVSSKAREYIDKIPFEGLRNRLTSFTDKQLQRL